jgi:transcriptional regulator NrdR family protein
MNCPECGSDRSRVVYSKRAKNFEVRVIRRRRRCFDCFKVYMTWEFKASDAIEIIARAKGK